MKRKILLRKILLCGIVVVLATGVFGWKALHADKRAQEDSASTEEPEFEYYYNDNDHPEDKVVQSSEEPAKEPAPIIKVDTDPQSITVLVNRDYLLPEEYIPEDLVKPNITFSFYGIYEKNYMRQVAATALEKLFAGASEAGFSLKGVSAYRSYSRQKEIYNRNVNTKGAENANRVSAIPGSSEHQTGLTIDVSASSVGCALEERFGESAEGKWLEKNSYKYGFIIRYPKGKEDITGYSYEPWHIRYVGKNLAKRLYRKKLTLEEYYQTTTEDNKVKPEDRVKDTDVGAPQEPQMTSAPTPNPSYKPQKSAKPKKTETPVPKKTKNPKKTETPVPAGTKQTKKPADTPKPTPKVTKEPVVTKEPAQEPSETVEPEPKDHTE